MVFLDNRLFATDRALNNTKICWASERMGIIMYTEGLK